jgi:putative cell wall-binding protein
MKRMINKRIFAVLMTIAMLLTYMPALSYALTEDFEDGGNAEVAGSVEAAEDVAVPEAETEDPVEQLEEPDALVGEEISAEEPETAVVDDSVSVDDLVYGFEASDSQEEQTEFVTFESKAAGDTSDVRTEDIRLFGKLRYDTAISVAEKYKESSGKFENVIVAYGQNFPDSLSGGYLAKVKKAPILLVEPSQENRIVKYISENIASGGRVYILGGTGVVSSSFESKVKAKGISTTRLGGKTRFETNLAILKAAGVKDEDILVCTGNDYADSLSASAVGKPILLVGKTLTQNQKNYIKGLSTKHIYLIGGSGAVRPAVNDELKALGFTPKRLFGQTRYDTSTVVAKYFFEKAETVVLAYALNFPDGLSGGPLAMLNNAPIILTDSDHTAAARSYVVSAGAVRSITLGGKTLISDAAVKRIMSFFKVVDKYANISKVGETAVIKTESNYGTKYVIGNGAIISVVSTESSRNSKGVLTETFTIKGNKSGTTVIKFNDIYSDLVAKPIVINVGELSVQNLHDIIEMTGYKNKNKDITVEPSVDKNDTRVFFVNHSDSVELVCAVQKSNISTYTSVIIPLEGSSRYQTRIIIETQDTIDKNTDVYPDGYTDSTKIDTNESVDAAFRSSMAVWNTVLGDNYGMEMKNLGFTQY